MILLLLLLLLLAVVIKARVWGYGLVYIHREMNDIFTLTTPLLSLTEMQRKPPESAIG